MKASRTARNVDLLVRNAHRTARASREQLDEQYGAPRVRRSKFETSIRRMIDTFFVDSRVDQTFLRNRLGEQQLQHTPSRPETQPEKNGEPSGSHHRSRQPQQTIIKQGALAEAFEQLETVPGLDSEQPTPSHSPAKQYPLETFWNRSFVRSYLKTHLKSHNVEDTRDVVLDILNCTSPDQPPTPTAPAQMPRGLHLIMRELILQSQYVPAKTALDCLEMSGLPLNLETLALALNLHAVSDDKSRFILYARQIDMSKYMHEVRTSEMSQLSSRCMWYAPLDKRFYTDKNNQNQNKHRTSTSPQTMTMLVDNFTSYNAQITQQPQTKDQVVSYMALFTSLIHGLCKFRHYEQIDVVLHHVIRQGFTLHEDMLRLNLEIGVKLADHTRLNWTTRYIDQHAGELRDKTGRLKQALGKAALFVQAPAACK